MSDWEHERLYWMVIGAAIGFCLGVVFTSALLQ